MKCRILTDPCQRYECAYHTHLHSAKPCIFQWNLTNNFQNPLLDTKIDWDSYLKRCKSLLKNQKWQIQIKPNTLTVSVKMNLSHAIIALLNITSIFSVFDCWPHKVDAERKLFQPKLICNSEYYELSGESFWVRRQSFAGRRISSLK